MALTNRKKVFIEEYLTTFNATESAKRAGYAEKSSRVTGHRLLSDHNIIAAIKTRVSEVAMAADEVLLRLAEQGRADIGQFIDSSGNFDFAKMKQSGATRLVKKVKITQLPGGVSQIEVELHDSQSALVHIGKYHKLFVDKSEISGPDNGPIELDQIAREARIFSIIDAARRRHLEMQGSGDLLQLADSARTPEKAAIEIEGDRSK